MRARVAARRYQQAMVVTGGKSVMAAVVATATMGATDRVLST